MVLPRVQMDTTEESLLRWHNEVVKNRWRVTRAWLGPFLPGVGIHHPESVRKILKGRLLVDYLYFNFLIEY